MSVKTRLTLKYVKTVRISSGYDYNPIYRKSL